MSKREKHVDIPIAGMAAFAGATPTHIRVEVGFNDGGTNLFSGKDEPKCFELTLMPITVPPDGRGFSTLLGDSRGIRVPLLPAPRFNAKRLDEVAATILPLADSLAAFIAAGNPGGAAEFARGIFKKTAA